MDLDFSTSTVTEPLSYQANGVEASIMSLKGPEIVSTRAEDL